MTRGLRIVSLLLLTVPTLALAQLGDPIEDFESVEENYRLDLPDDKYLPLDMSDSVPEASFTAMRAGLRATTIIITEKIGDALSLPDYSTSVIEAMRARLERLPDSEITSVSNAVDNQYGAYETLQTRVEVEAAGADLTYLITVFKDGERAYQFATAAPREHADNLQTATSELFDAFSVIDGEKNNRLTRIPRPIRGYQSDTFGYSFGLDRPWLAWTDLWDDAPYTDHGALHPRSYGGLLIPVCWPGAAPPAAAIYNAMMQQVDEEYPSSFVLRESDIEKDGARGKLLIGRTVQEDIEFEYYHWIVANEQCAYMVYAWGPSTAEALEKNVTEMWDGFSIAGTATAAAGRYGDDNEARIGAQMLATLGAHMSEAQSHRDAFRFLEAASDAQPESIDYLTRALRSLSAIDAYQEARDWLEARSDRNADNQFVQSWRAWLAYNVGDYEMGTQIYADLFDDGYRDDEDFSAYLTMLSELSLWEQVDARYEQYTAGGENDRNRRLYARLLSRRGESERALDVLDAMIKPGGVLDAELAYDRLDVMDDMDAATRMKTLAQELIDAGYPSLRSYFYLGRAQYLLSDYVNARETFLTADKYAPGNETIREYLSAIDNAMGQGDASLIKTAIGPIDTPREIKKIVDNLDLPPSGEGNSAEYIYRVSGFDYTGGNRLKRTTWLKVRILDNRGLDDFGSLSFDFDPAYERLYVNELIVRDAEGSVIAEGDPDSYYVTTVTDGFEASTERTAHFPVPGLAPNTTVELKLTTETDVAPGDFPLDTIFFARSQPVLQSVVFVTGKLDKLQWKGFRAPEPDISRGMALWSLNEPMPFRWEPLLPDFDKVTPWVRIGTAESDWNSVGREYLEEIKDKLDHDSMASRASRLIEGVTGEERQVELLSTFVQDEVQYQAIEFGRRAYIPKTARETLRDRYGDCKDHAVLLNGLLQAAGFDSALALVSLGEQVVPEIASRDQFNHMVVRVTVNGEHRFIDATDKSLRLGSAPPRSLGGTYALILHDNPELVQIPGYAGVTGKITVDREVDVNDDSTLLISERTTFSGYQAAQMRSELRDIETTDLQDSLQRWLNRYLPDATIEDYFVDNLLDARFDLDLEIRFRLPVSDLETFEVPAFMETAYLQYDRVAERRFEFELLYPMEMASRTAVKSASAILPSGDTALSEAEESAFGTWKRDVNRFDDALQIEFQFDSGSALYPAGDYAEFADFQKRAADAAAVSLESN